MVAVRLVRRVATAARLPMPTVTGVSTLMHPVGPASPGVYWRRRAVIAILLLLLVGGAYSVVGALTSAADEGTGADHSAGQADDGPGDPSADGGAAGDTATSPSTTGTSTSPTTTGTSTADPSTASSTSGATAPSTTGAAGAGACGPESLAVLVSTDDARYSPDAVPVVTMTLRNDGEAPCDVETGSAAVELVVTSGSDRVWSSDDCEQQGGSRVVSLDPGAEDSTTVQWRRERSAPGCRDDLPEPRPGTYVVTGRIGELTSDGVSFVLD